MIITYQHIDVTAASKLVAYAMEHAVANGWNIAVCVVDGAGSTVASARMDGVQSQILLFAEDKAFTAATMRRSTSEYFERMEQSPSLRLGLMSRDRLLVWGGGVPINYKGTIVGGIGVSGAQEQEDTACATEALRRIGLTG